MSRCSFPGCMAIARCNNAYRDCEAQPAPPASRSLEERALQYAKENTPPVGNGENYAFRAALWGLKQGEEERRKLQNTINEYEMRDPLLRAENAALSTRLAEAEKALEKIAEIGHVQKSEDPHADLHNLQAVIAREALRLLRGEA